MKEINIDTQTLKALSVNTRTKILKLLLSKNYTQTDLAEILNLSIPSVKEHLDFLEKVNLVEKLEEGRKWKYYKTTDKTKSLFNSEFNKFIITLGIFIISAGSTLILLFQKTSNFMAEKSAISELSQIGELYQKVSLPKEEPSILIFIFSFILIISLMLSIIFLIKYKKVPYKLLGKNLRKK